MHFKKEAKNQGEARNAEEEHAQAEMRNRVKNITNDIYSTIKSSYGFVVNPLYSASKKASILIQHMPSWHYFTSPTNLVMHDLTNFATTAPRSLQSIIGVPPEDQTGN